MASKDPRFFVNITRVDEDERMVYGYGTRQDVVDSYGTVIDLESVKRCMKDYMKFPTVREMHQMVAAGKTEEYTTDEVGIMLGVKVVDDQAWKKVKEQVYRGFSIGGKKDYQEGNRIFLKSITEFSLVDRPSNEGCTIDEFRIYQVEDQNMADGAEVKVEEPAQPVERSTIDGDLKRYAGEEVYDAQTALYALSNIMYLFEKEKAEMHPEAGEQLTALKAVIENLKTFISSEVKEVTTDTGEVSMAAGAEDEVKRTDPEDMDDVTRKGASISGKNMERLQAIHDHCVDMGCRCSSGGDVEKADKADITRMAALEDDVKRLSTENETLVKRIADLEKMPEPAKGSVTVVEKADDAVRSAEEAEVKRIEQLPPAEAAIELVKRAQQKPNFIGIR